MYNPTVDKFTDKIAMTIAKIFTDLGLRAEHSKIYRAALEWGETSITNIAEHAGLPRTSAYPYVEELVEVGILRQSVKRGHKNYIPADPDYLLVLLEDRSTEIQRSIDNFKKETMMDLITIQKKDNKPKVQYLEGADGIKQAYERSLKADGETLVQCFTADYGEVVSEKFFSDYFAKFFSSGKPTKEIITATKDDEAYAKKWGTDINKHMLVDAGEGIETDVIIYDDTVIFISFSKSNPYALVVEDSEITKAMRVMYGLAWKGSKKT